MICHINFMIGAFLHLFKFENDFSFLFWYDTELINVGVFIVMSFKCSDRFLYAEM